MGRYRKFIITACAAIVVAAVIYWCTPRHGEGHGEGLSVPEEIQEINILYGIDYTDLVIEEGTIAQGQTLSHIFGQYGIGPAMIDRTARASDSVFNLRNMKAGNNYTAFFTADSLERLVHFVYEHNTTDYIVISYPGGDSVIVRKENKPVITQRTTATATITSSLWNAMIKAGMNPVLPKELEDIYQWSIDFFGLREGDYFTLVYDDLRVDSVSVGIGRIWGAIFNHAGRDYYAIPFKQDGTVTYWDEQGNSLRKSMLLAPLKYSRISSRFSNSRMHPVLKIRRPHHGVDYAAPAGTPVHAVADGVVTFRGWDSKGGGNTLKIKHSASLSTGYLHLRDFAKGITVGSRVRQGELIGFVGSTGTSTGPHLDYRVWKDGKPIDPLSITSEPAEPISQANRADFEFVRDRILAELQGTVPDSLKITQLDSLHVYRRLTPQNKPVNDTL